MINIDELDITTLSGGFFGVVAILGLSIIYLYRKQEAAEEEEQVDAVMEDVSEMVIDTLVTKKNKHQRKNDQWKPKSKEASYEHPWYVTTLKTHTSDVTGMDFASDGKKFVSVSDDRTVVLWDVRDFEEKEHKCTRQVLSFDTATHVVFGPDCKSVVFSTKRENTLAVYRINKKDGGGHLLSHIENLVFEKKHVADISHIGIASTGNFLFSTAIDGKIVLYDIRGNVLKIFDGNVSTLHDCSLSPDGRFIAVSGFSPDVFVYEPIFTKDKTFQDVKKAFILGGHNSGVLAAAFNATSSRAVTVSKDGKWRVFDTDIRYNAGQDAKIVAEGNWEPLKGASADHVRLAISPTGDSFAASVNESLKVFSSWDEKADFQELENLHTACIKSIKFSSEGKYIATSGDRYIRIIRNVPEYHTQVVKFSKQLTETNGESARNRLRQQIEEAKKELKKYSD